MTIAWILDTYPSVSETFIARDIETLRKRGVGVEIFAFNAGIGAHPIDVSLLDRLRGAVASRTGLSEWKTRLVGERLGAEIKAGRFAALGITHVHGGWASHPADVARAAARTANLPWSFSGHARDLWVEGKDLDVKVREARFATVCTQAGARFLCEHAPEESSKVHYIPHGIDLETFPFQNYLAPRENEPFRILGIGRLVPKKGWPIFLEALALLQENSKLFRATIIGEGAERRRLESLIDRLSLTELVSLRGALPQDAVREELRVSHCLVFSGITAPDGDRDGLPNVLLEAAANGIPIVATDSGSIRDLGDERAMRICEPSPKNLATSIADVLENSEAASARTRVARRCVENGFDALKTGSLRHALFLENQSVSPPNGSR